MLQMPNTYAIITEQELLTHYVRILENGDWIARCPENFIGSDACVKSFSHYKASHNQLVFY